MVEESLDDALRLRRLYAALSQINQVIVRAAAREHLYAEICRALVEFGGFRMAWIGAVDSGSLRVEPAASFGDDQGYLAQVAIFADQRPQGVGPTGTAIRHQRTYVCNDFLGDPATQPWHEAARRCGFRASAAIPVVVSGSAVASVNVYAAEAGFFREQEVALLERAAVDLAFALENMEREAQRVQAEVALRASEERLNLVAANARVGLVMIDRQHRYAFANSTYLEIFGLRDARILGQRIADVLPVLYDEQIRPRLERAFAGERVQYELRRPTSSGASYYTVRYEPTAVAGTVAQVVAVITEITDRKQAEEALRASERRLRLVTENAGLGFVVISRERRYVYCNLVYAEMIGQPVSAVVGGRLADVLGDVYRERVQAWLDRAFEGQRVEFEVRRSSASGERHYSITYEPWRGEAPVRVVVGVVTDITDRIRSEARYRALFEGAPDGILIADQRSYYQDANASMCRMLDYSREELIGLHASDIVLPSEQEHIEPALLQLQAGAHYHREWQFRRRDGTTFPAEVIATVMPDGNLMGMVRDITERRRAQENLRELNETLELKVAQRTAELEVAVRRAEDADQVKSTFLAAMSHELRTPLNSIIGFTGIVLQGLPGPLNPEQRRQLGMVRNSANHLLALINDVLDLSKIEAGRTDLRIETFDLTAVAGRCIESVRPAAAEKHLTLDAQLGTGLDAMISDGRRIEQILLNLLNNAIKFTERGGVTLSVQRAGDAEAADASPARPMVRLQVTDTGIGIRPADLPLLFRPFQQLDASATRRHEGTGLGLAICGRLTQALGGEIKVDSVWGSGSSFTVVLPLCREQP